MPAVPSDITSVVSELTTSVEVFKGQLRDAFTSLDLTTVAAILLVVVGAILLYDLLVYALASASTRRSLMMTPLLSQLATNAWDMRDELGLSNMIESRSLETVSPILETIFMAMDKYEKRE
ncbi:uncharacterized protein LOC121853790 [Homarus americanus]|uniref:Uncharacterized protein n=1 Tax=Homarus americanus TaxID=6706 RepID=A0A8J5JHA5_HOMAM|nr:uncharacterized protein LOC121853790 [Homarus americanus]KAG7156296.1 hypothetical protein Hamer_G006018 [Homarus americanus]